MRTLKMGNCARAPDEFTKAIDLAPNVPTSYLNRGYVLNDLRQGDHAAKDFEMAI